GLRVDAEQAGVADRVHFVDPVGSDDVVAFLSTADIGVHPMHGGIPNHEMALPNKLFEYLHAGLPLVVTDLQVLGAFVREHGIGQTFPSEDAEGLAAAVSKVIDDLSSYQQAVSDPELRATFTWERQADVLRQVYDELLGPA
ncbi:MAG TPA: glycosyltransferase, partial [Jiangellaceae bacterium]